jgi:hypothetical protein
MKVIFTWMIIHLVGYVSLGQQFEVINAAIDLRGLAEDGKQIVIYGNGLTWINEAGEQQGSLNLIKGMSLTRIVDVQSDGAGGLWVLTLGALGHVNPDKTSVRVFETKEFEAEGKQLKVMRDGTLFVLMRNKIIRVNRDLSYDLYYAATDKNVVYFDVFDVNEDRQVYMGSNKGIFILDKEKNLNVVSPSRKLNLQQVNITKDNRIFVLDYNRLFELVENELRIVLDYSQLSPGAKFYTGVFNTGSDYWLYSNNGNVFHYDNGSWFNFIPPSGMKTGNFGECMIQTQAGHTWLSLGSFPYLLRYDGTKWEKLLVEGNELKTGITQSQWIQGDQLYALEPVTFFPLKWNGSVFEPIARLPKVKMYNVAMDSKGQYYWGAEGGIFTNSGNEVIKLVDHKDPRSFEILGDELFFVDDEKLCKLKNGQQEYIDPIIHHLGWEPLHIYSVKIYHTGDQQLFFTNGARPGLISTYADGAWGKIIEIEGKRIGGIDNIMTYGDQTFIVTITGSVAVYANKTFHWLYYQTEPQNNVHRSFLTPDGNVWYVTSDKELKRINHLGLVNKVVVPYDSPNYALKAVLKYKDEVYDLYFEKTVFRVDFNQE